MDTLKRITDLFVEGHEAYLGDHPTTHEPVVVWVNKPNAFEKEEAQRDGIVRRAERIAELGRDSAECRALLVELEEWTDRELAQRIAGYEADRIHLDALNDLATDLGFRKLEGYIQRASELQRDESLAENDPRLATLSEKAEEYTRRIEEARATLTDERVEDLERESRDKLIRIFIEKWRSQLAFGEYMDGKRTTELYLAVRKCAATEITAQVSLAGEVVPTERVWDHSQCDHSARLFSNRSSVRKVPDRAMNIIVRIFEDQQVGPRDAGFSAAPESSSTSSEPSDEVEGPSTASFQGETPAERPTS